MEISDLQILRFEEADLRLEKKKGRYFELLYFKKAEGLLEINTCRYSVQDNSLFVLSPDDRYVLHCNSENVVLAIRFSQTYLRIDQSVPVEGLQNMEYVIFHHYRNKGCIWDNAADKVFAMVLLAQLISEYDGKEAYRDLLLRQSLFLLLTLIVRNLKTNLITNEPAVSIHKTDYLELLDYLQRNIYFPEKLTIRHLSNTFHLSENYIGAFFKNRQGVSIQEFINQYRMQLISSRLATGNKRIKEISQEFGFSSEAYFVRFFKQRMRVTPVAFRKTFQ